MLRLHRTTVIVLALLVALPGAVSTFAYHEDDVTIHPWADARFENRWARTDLPVLEGAAVRTWIWGPSPYTEGRMEPYLESPGGQRLVQYMDKSRMELNNPDDPDTSIWTVTQGLLALDMMLGQVQVGDAAFVPHSEGPSTENVAGDPGPDNGPTYATMATVMDEPARAEGTVITERLSLAGEISQDAGLAAYNVTAAHHVQQDWIDHTVASVFWDFMNSEGVIWDGELTQGSLFPDPFYAVGLPTTEAYWTTVLVDGDLMDVLLQCFERRCLTYAPGNPEGWMVEAGNVGQHYYRWLETHVGPLVPDVTVLAEGLVQPRHATYTADGVYVAEAGMGGDACITLEEEFEGELEVFDVCVGPSGAVTLVENGTQSRVAEGLPSIEVFEEAGGPHDVAFDSEGNMYVSIGFGFEFTPEIRDEFGAAGELLGTIVRVDGPNDFTLIADILEYEFTENPDGSAMDSNPYGMTYHDGALILADAGGNSLLHIDLDDGAISTIAVFDARIVPAPPFIPVDEIPMDAVPTDVEVGPDGNYYVSQLTGFPFPVGGANVYQVTPEGQVEVFASGFTTIGAIDFDSQGRLIVLEMTAGGFLAVDEEAIEGGDLSSVASRIVRVEADGSHTNLVVFGVYFGTGLAVGSADELYVVHLSVVPFAQLVRIGDPAEALQSFSTVMSGAEEVVAEGDPPVDTTATGNASFEVSADGNSISFEVYVEDLVNTTMAHIHLAPAGENGPVVVWLYPLSPPAELIPGSFTGLLSSGTITADDLVGPLEGEGLSALIDAMVAGNAYVNVHTETYPAGEIRGQIAAEHIH